MPTRCALLSVSSMFFRIVPRARSTSSVVIGDGAGRRVERRERRWCVASAIDWSLRTSASNIT